MFDLLSMLGMTALAMVVLMAYIAINKESKNTLIDSLAWGIGGFVSFSTEIFVVWKSVW